MHLSMLDGLHLSSLRRVSCLTLSARSQSPLVPARASGSRNDASFSALSNWSREGIRSAYWFARYGQPQTVLRNHCFRRHVDVLRGHDERCPRHHLRCITSSGTRNVRIEQCADLDVAVKLHAAILPGANRLLI